MMVFWQPITTLKDYATNKPPGVTFFLCLLALALSCMCLGAYSLTHILPNPDTVMDWNHLLSSIAQHHLCVKNNTSSMPPVETLSSFKAQELQTENQLRSPTIPISVTQLHLQVPLILTSMSEGLKDVSLHTSFSASQLQLEGNETLSVTVEFIATDDSNVCLTIIAPTYLLSISPLPPACPQTVRNIQVVNTEARKEVASGLLCYSLQAKYDPALQVMLTKEEQLVAVRHLLEAGVVLIAVCLILCLSVSFTHSLAQHKHWKDQDRQNQPLIDN